MKKTRWRKILAFVLVFCLTLNITSAAVLAAEIELVTDIMTSEEPTGDDQPADAAAPAGDTEAESEAVDDETNTDLVQDFSVLTGSLDEADATNEAAGEAETGGGLLESATAANGGSEAASGENDSDLVQDFSVLTGSLDKANETNEADGEAEVAETAADGEPVNDGINTGIAGGGKGLLLPHLLPVAQDAAAAAAAGGEPEHTWEASQAVVDAMQNAQVTDEAGKEVSAWDKALTGEGMTPEEFKEIFGSTPAELDAKAHALAENCEAWIVETGEAYATLAEALQAQQPGQTVQLLQNVVVDAPLTLDDSAEYGIATIGWGDEIADGETMLDLGGKEITVSETITVDKAITIANGTITREADVNIFDVTGSLTLDNVTLQGVYANETYYTEAYGEPVEAHSVNSPVMIEEGGVLVMSNGSAITGFYARFGGGVNTKGALVLKSNAHIDGNTV